MIKNYFEKELSITTTCSKKTSNNKSDVMKIQSWLTLYAMQHPQAGTATRIDGSFGPATEKAVMNFQVVMRLQPTGMVDEILFSYLSQPLLNAFQYSPDKKTLRNKIVQTAHAHLSAAPCEVAINGELNSGPWVRSYMDGNQGNNWLWCMGFAQSILDQAMSSEGKDFRSFIPLSYSCDVVAKHALRQKCFVENKNLRTNPSLVKPGDLFLLRRKEDDWYHTGIIVAANKTFIETIEGNTNPDGSSNGYGVFSRRRNFKSSQIDIITLNCY